MYEQVHLGVHSIYMVLYTGVVLPHEARKKQTDRRKKVKWTEEVIGPALENTAEPCVRYIPNNRVSLQGKYKVSTAMIDDLTTLTFYLTHL